MLDIFVDRIDNDSTNLHVTKCDYSDIVGKGKLTGFRFIKRVRGDS